MVIDETDEWLSPGVAGRALGVSGSRVSQLAAEGRLTCKRTALGRVVSRASVLALARARGILADEVRA